MIKIYADEDVDKSVVLSLKGKGVDITSVDQEERKDLSDKEQFNFAIKEDRAVLTEDSDFVKISEGEKHHGILFIPKKRKPPEVVKKVIRILELLDEEDLEGEIVFV